MQHTKCTLFKSKQRGEKYKRKQTWTTYNQYTLTIKTTHTCFSCYTLCILVTMNPFKEIKHMVLIQGDYETLSRTTMGTYTVHLGNNRNFRHIVMSTPGVSKLTIMMSNFSIKTGLKLFARQIRYLSKNIHNLYITLVTPIAMRQTSLHFLRKKEHALLTAIHDCPNVIMHRTSEIQYQCPFDLYINGSWIGLEYLSRSLFNMGIPVSLENTPSRKCSIYKAKMSSKGSTR